MKQQQLLQKAVKSQPGLTAAMMKKVKCTKRPNLITKATTSMMMRSTGEEQSVVVVTKNVIAMKKTDLVDAVTETSSVIDGAMTGVMTKKMSSVVTTAVTGVRTPRTPGPKSPKILKSPKNPKLHALQLSAPTSPQRNSA